MTLFYLGSHQPHWLWTVEFPQFVSHRQLAREARRGRTTRPAVCRWALDSGGFTELSMYGRWVTSPEEYVEAVAMYVDRIGNLDFAAPQDWMCEPHMIDRTGLSVAEHQYRTVENYLTLRDLAPGLPIIPCLQGWDLADYLACADLYASAGVDLASLPRVGLGSVCRRQSTEQIGTLVAQLGEKGLQLHGFGVKTGGLALYGEQLASADSLAWSYAGRREGPLPGCTHGNCANCLKFATRWRSRVLAKMASSTE